MDAFDRTVLVVEDEVDTAEMFAEMMHLSGYQVLKSYAGHQALSLITNEKPDVVVLDIMMPDISGLEVLRFIQRDPRLDHIPVVIVSAKNQPEDIQSGLEAGAQCYLTKPVTYQELRNAVADALLESGPGTQIL